MRRRVTKHGEGLGAAGLELDRREVVAARRAAVDDHDRDAPLVRRAYEAQPGHDLQRRAEHDERLGLLDQRVAALDPVLGHVLAEEHDVGLEVAAARRALGDAEVGGVVQHDVAVGRHLADARLVAGVEQREPGVQLGSWSQLAALQADHPVDAAVQVDHVPVAGAPVQPVDVLRDEAGRGARRAPASAKAWCVALGSRPAHPAPADVGACPVALPTLGRTHEVLVRHRRPHRRARPAVVGDPGVGRHPGAGQHEPAPIAEDLGRTAAHTPSMPLGGQRGVRFLVG